MLTIASVNVNGLRAAVRKGMLRWLDECAPDIVTLQEVRAPNDLMGELLTDRWHIAHVECGQPGRAGVAVLSRPPLSDIRDGGRDPRLAGTGRWIEVDITVGPTPDAAASSPRLTIISAYAHTGDADDPARMAEKLAFFDAMENRLSNLRADGRLVLLTGDLNVAHREVDIKNWRGNVGSAGFLPVERARFDRWFDHFGWVDLGRRFGGTGPGPYTWWSYRGRAYDNDAGWRIDYQIASPELADLATEAWVDRRAAYHERWSDHAPLVVRYDLSHPRPTPVAPDSHREIDGS